MSCTIVFPMIAILSPVPNSLVIQSSSSQEGYALVTNVPEHYIDNSSANGNFDLVDEYDEADYIRDYDRFKKASSL